MGSKKTMSWGIIAGMKELNKLLKDHLHLVFIDLEGTQVTHEIIEIGAYKVDLRKDLTVKKIFKPFKVYVKPKGGIGNFVTKLTGIDSKIIREKGITFRLAQQQLQKYVGRQYKKCLFVAYGDQDAKMFIASAEHNMDASMEEARYVSKHTVDFAAFLKHYVTDEHGNGRSLSHNLELFNVKFEGQAHDACADAYNLILLYKAFLEKKDIVREEYRKTLLRSRSVPEPIRKIVTKIAETGSATIDDLNRSIDEELE